MINNFKRILSFFLCLSFAATLAVPPSLAQTLMGQDLDSLPQPGSMVNLSHAMNPPVLRGIKVFVKDPLRFDFILDPGDKGRAAMLHGQLDPEMQAQFKETSTRLLKYFLTTLTVPDNDIWVNLSPYEKNRIVSPKFGETEMGRDLLGQDYLLKQITASLIFPQGDAGKKFWARVYKESKEKFGSTQIPVNTFNKVWIMPEKAVVYEKLGDNQATAFVLQSRLKVMLESDYIALKGHKAAAALGAQEQGAATDIQKLGRDVTRAVIIPILEKEVNEGKNFAPLRQIYSSILLAMWYKEKMKGSILSSTYVNQGKIAGVDIQDKNAAQKIWQRYVQAYKKGAINIISEEKDPVTDKMTPRKYFAGGFELGNFAMSSVKKLTGNSARIFAAFMATGLAVLTAGCGVGGGSLLGIQPSIFGPTASVPATVVYSNTNGGAPETIAIGEVNGLLTVERDSIEGNKLESFNLSTHQINVSTTGVIIGRTTSYSPGAMGYPDQLAQFESVLNTPSNQGKQGIVLAAQNTLNTALRSTPSGTQPQPLDLEIPEGGSSYTVITDLYGNVSVIAGNVIGSSSYTYFSGALYGKPPSVEVRNGFGVNNYPIAGDQGRKNLSLMLDVLNQISNSSPNYKAQLADVIASLQAALQTAGGQTPAIYTSSSPVMPLVSIYSDTAHYLNISAGIIKNNNGNFLTIKQDTNTGSHVWSLNLTTGVVSTFSIGSIVGPTKSYAPTDSSYKTVLGQLLTVLNTSSNTDNQRILQTAYNTVNNALQSAPEPSVQAPSVNEGAVSIDVTAPNAGYNVTTDVYGDVTTTANVQGGSVSYTFYAGSINSINNDGLPSVFVYSRAKNGNFHVNTPEGVNALSDMIQVLQIMSSRASDVDEKQKLANITTSLEAVLATAQMTSRESSNQAMKGGIDLTKNSTPLEVRNNAGKIINFTIDPAQIQRINLAAGLTPEVYTISPLQNLPEFLGMSREETRELVA